VSFHPYSDDSNSFISCSQNPRNKLPKSKHSNLCRTDNDTGRLRKNKNSSNQFDADILSEDARDAFSVRKNAQNNTENISTNEKDASFKLTNHSSGSPRNLEKSLNFSDNIKKIEVDRKTISAQTKRKRKRLKSCDFADDDEGEESSHLEFAVSWRPDSVSSSINL